MTQNSWAGKTLGGRYQIEELLGQGGMSAVYKAMDPNLQRVVAVKMIHSHLSDNEEFVRRFEEEATAVAQLRHPNIIQVFDFNNDDGTYYMVLEFVPGETLQERLKRLNADGRNLPVEEAIKYIINVCEAADYAHKRGMIHRDIKPANVMLDVNGQAILMDFGIAKIVGGQQHTATGAVIGTALYMAPEQIRGERADERVDIYAIGVTLFEILTGHPPYEADSAMTLMMMHLNDPLPDLRQIQPHVPDDLVAVVEKALAKDRSQRYQSGAEMAVALHKVLDRLYGQASVSPTVASGSNVEGPALEANFAEQPVEEPAPVGMASDQGIIIESPTLASEGEDAGVIQVVPPTGDTLVESAAMASPGVMSSGSPSAQADPANGAPRKRNMALIGAGVAVLFIILCAIVGGVFAFGQFSAGRADSGSTGVASGATQTTAALALGGLSDSDQPTATSEPTSTFTAVLPTATPTTENTPLLDYSPTPTVPPGIPYVRINDISLDGETYVVDYETFEYTEQLPGMHVHFFFDTVPVEQAGVPGDGPWKLYGGPRPFTEYTTNNRPVGAKQMCALVANSNHSIQPESGNCVNLPDVEPESSVLNDASVSPSPSPSPTLIPTVQPTKEKKSKDNY